MLNIVQTIDIYRNISAYTGALENANKFDMHVYVTMSLSATNNLFE